MAICNGLLDNRFECWLLNGLYDVRNLTNIKEHQHLQLDEKSVCALSPVEQIGKQSVEKLPRAIRIVSAELDSPAFIEQSQKFHDACKSLKNVEELTIQIEREQDHFWLADYPERSNILKQLYAKFLLC
ncbi:hypothetical protein ACOME3_002773 [Neoechinorhynchus agilis]